ncbi:ABC transporter ATP-binding protein [Conexibacter woesei]|uniref:ABC transporter related protein n=1 Tax=Conexibacter woesei (strain DSM 14684 / CCUG 47730 / CIP 108061 / JCM 11494 / NBRC 100937 / ID131577) TaxID=469383 RepID=D3F595_CONWI|nr:ABC transporter ATP-binding protein [Conexibacter woesei]ADB50562.1 ABC transporter related protein [Conexibacter woesei DSM 14684]
MNPHASPAAIAACALELDRVDAGYGTTTVLRDLSLRVRPGQVVALLGPNGAGKTTTLRAAAGTVRPAGGQVRLFGQDVTPLAPHRRARAGLCLIPEGRGIFRSLTVRENLRLHDVAIGGDGRGEALERALDAFPDLESRLDHHAGHLSGGQQQMLALARAYVARPRVILLDEVSMGLAPLIVEQIFTALRDLAATGVAMLIVEQYVAQALDLADHVVLLNKGAVTYDGSPSGLDQDALLAGYLGVDFGQAP